MPSGPPTPGIRPSPLSLPVNLSHTKLSPNPGSTSDVTTPPEPAPIPSLQAPISQRPQPPRRTSTAPLQRIRPLPPPTAASPTAISTALLVSSCAKLFPILLVIWGADRSGASNQPAADTSAGLSASRGTAPGSLFLESWLAAAESSLRPYLPTRYLTGLFDYLASLLSLGVVDTHLVLLSNIEALYILLGCGYLRAVAVAVAGQIARWAVQRVILGAVGVG